MYETPDDAAEYGELAEINEQLDDDEILTDDGEPESPTVTELTNDDFPAYFTERENHLFHSHGNSTYPLPVDGYEIQRMNVMHQILFRVFGSHYVGPVDDVLRIDPDRKGLVIDLGTGTGRWPMAMAKVFPHVKFRGVDLVPISTRFPAKRVRFELADIGEPSRWDNGSVDMVHGREIGLSVMDYRTIINEAGRLLRPGGLFLSVEWQLTPQGHPVEGTPISDWCNLVRHNLLQHRGVDIDNIPLQIPEYIRQSGLFSDPNTVTREVPIGHWPPEPEDKSTGMACRLAFQHFSRNLSVFLSDVGVSRQLIRDQLHYLRVALHNTTGLHLTYHATFARRLA